LLTLLQIRKFWIFVDLDIFIIFILWVFPEFAVGAFTLFYCKIALLATVFPKLSARFIPVSVRTFATVDVFPTDFARFYRFGWW